MQNALDREATPILLSPFRHSYVDLDVPARREEAVVIAAGVPYFMSALNNAVRKVQKTENSWLKVQSFFT